MSEPAQKLIHVAAMRKWHGPACYLFLRQKNQHHYVWYEKTANSPEIETEVSGPNIEEAIRLARRHWNAHSFRTVICGFRYTLPERDEHGMNALYCQMAASLNSPNGIYFDEELGHNCIVQNASLEARNLWLAHIT